MKWWHWLLMAAAIGILVLNQMILPGSGQTGRYIMYHYFLEIVYFFIMLVLGIAIGRVMQKRLWERQDKEEYLKSIRIYRLLSLLFVLAAALYLLTGWIPGWIGRHIIFFGGYYYGLTRLEKDQSK